MGTVVPAALCPTLGSCQALSRVLIIFLISNRELLCCFSTQILSRQGALMLIRFNFSTMTYHVLHNPAGNWGCVLAEEQALGVWLRQWNPMWDPSTVLDELALGAGCGRSLVCRLMVLWKLLQGQPVRQAKSVTSVTQGSVLQSSSGWTGSSLSWSLFLTGLWQVCQRIATVRA